MLPAIALGVGVGVGVSTYLTPALEPTKRQQIWIANENDPNLVPPPETIIRMLQGGLLDENNAAVMLKYYGIDLKGTGPGNNANYRDILWRNAVWQSRPSFDVASLVELRARGLLADNEYDRLWKRTGAIGTDWQSHLDSLQHRMSVVDILTATNRELLNEDELLVKLRSIGFVGPDERRMLNSLRRYMPPVSDVIRFAVKDVFDAAIAEKNQLFDDYPDAAKQFAKWNGMDWESGYYNPSTDQNATIDELYWAAHWQPIDPTQAYQMLHRIRGDNIDAVRKLVGNPKLQPFTHKDVRDWLKVADYPKGIRDQLLAISYRPLVRRDIQAMRNAGVLKRPGILAAYLDMGYSPENAELQTDLVERKAEAKAIVRSRTKVIGSLSLAYKEGVIDRGTSLVRLTDILRTDPEVNNPASEAEGILLTIDMGVQTALLKRAVNSVRRDFLLGAINAGRARDELNKIGVVEPRLTETLRSWQLDLNHPRRVASTQKVIEWYVQGLMTRLAAAERLFNLGWTDADRALYLLEGDELIGKRIELAQIRAAKDQQARARAVETNFRKARAEMDRQIGELTRQSSPAMMQKWYLAGLIEKETIASRLSFMEWTSDNIQRYLEALPEREEPENADDSEIQKTGS